MTIPNSYEPLAVPKKGSQKFVQPLLLKDFAVGGDNFAARVSSQLGGNSPAYVAFDGNIRSYWHSANYMPQYIDFYNPKPIRVISLDVVNSPEGLHGGITAGTVQGSHDGDTWEVISNWTNSVTGANAKWKITVNSTKHYKYHRIHITATSYWNWGNPYTVVGEVTVNAMTNPEYLYKPGWFDVTDVGAGIYDGTVYTSAVGDTRSWLVIPVSLTPLATASNWEFRTKFTYHSGGPTSVAAVIIGKAQPPDGTVPFLGVQRATKKLITYVGNGSSYNIANGVLSANPINEGVDYYIRFGFDGSKYYAALSQNGFDECVDFITVKSAVKAGFGSCPWALLNDLYNWEGNNYSPSSIDLAQTSIIVNGSRYWEAVKF